MSQPTIKKIDFYLAGLSQRHASAMNMQVLSQRNAAWRVCAEEPLASHVRVALYSEGRLTLHADASIWCNKLLHLQQTLIRKLRQHALFCDLTGLHVRVVPLTRAAQQRSLPPRELTSRAAEVIAGAADGIVDSELAQALRQLARRTRPV